MEKISENFFCWMARALVCAGIVLLAGCSAALNSFNSGWAAKPLALNEVSAEDLSIQLGKRVLDLDKCFADKYRTSAEGAVFCAGQRNQAVALLMEASVRLCTEHLTSIYGNEAAFNIATGSVAGLTSAVAAISPLSRAQALSALSAFANAERSLVNESIYKSMLTTAIATKIKESRAAGANSLLVKANTRYDDYRIESAMHDVREFHASCAFHRGLELALEEGTNTNLQTKRQAIEVRLQALQSQIDTRATILGLDATGKRDLLDEKQGAATIRDPILRSLVERYMALALELQQADQMQVASAQKKASSTDSLLPVLDPSKVGVSDLLAEVSSAIEAVRAAPQNAAEDISKEAKRSNKDVPKPYLDALRTEYAIDKSFRSTLQAALIPDPDAKGSVPSTMAAFDAVYRQYLAGVSKLDLSVAADRMKQIDLGATVMKEAINVEALAAKIRSCRAAALKKVADGKQAELEKLKAKTLSDDDFGKLDKLQDTARKPSWAASDSAQCLK